MISNSNKTINKSNLPNVSLAMAGWFQPISLRIIKSETINYEVLETVTKINSRGVWQPYTAQQLSILPEGHRAWSWFMLHVLPSVKLAIYDRIEYEGEVYRVMRVSDYSKYGYYEYDVIFDYQYQLDDTVIETPPIAPPGEEEEPEEPIDPEAPDEPEEPVDPEEPIDPEDPIDPGED